MPAGPVQAMPPAQPAPPAESKPVRAALRGGGRAGGAGKQGSLGLFRSLPSYTSLPGSLCSRTYSPLQEPLPEMGISLQHSWICCSDRTFSFTHLRV